MSTPTTTASSPAQSKGFAAKKRRNRTQLHGGSVHRGTGGRGETKKLATATLP